MYLPVRLKKFLFLTLFFSLIELTFAQNFDKLYEQTSVLIDQDQYQKAFDKCLELDNLGNENNDNLQISKANYLLAKTFKKQENYLQTIKYATRSNDFAQTNQNLEYQIKSGELLAWAYVYIGFYDQANAILDDLNKLLNDYNGDNKHFLNYKILYRKASLLRKQDEKPKQVLQVYFKALNEIKQFNFKNDSYEKNENFLSLYNNIGLTFKKINIDSAFHYYQKAHQFIDKNDTRGVADLEANMASFYVDKNENEKAISLLHKSIPTLIKSEHKFLTSESYKILSDAYKNEGDEVKSAEYNTLYLTYKDSLNVKRNQSVNDAIEYLKKTSHKNDAINQNTPNYFLIISIVVILVFAFILVFKKKKSL